MSSGDRNAGGIFFGKMRAKLFLKISTHLLTVLTISVINVIEQKRRAADANQIIKR